MVVIVTGKYASDLSTNMLAQATSHVAGMIDERLIKYARHGLPLSYSYLVCLIP